MCRRCNGTGTSSFGVCPECNGKKDTPQEPPAPGKPGSVTGYVFRLDYSEADKEYVGLCDHYPYLSYLDADKEKAMVGIMRLVVDLEET